MESQSIRTLQKKRTSNFREDETKLLIQLWGSPYIQNKLYLTHRKAPVMRVLAANMQQRGFFRTPDEIKTRIRNLKCLYHRIKRTTTYGTGVGIVDPDWPHFKAMDAILSKEAPKRPDQLIEGVLEGPRCEDIKQEVDIDINDDMDSWATNDSMGSTTSEEPTPSIILKPTATLKPKPKEPESTAPPQPAKPMPTLLPGFSISNQNTPIKPGTAQMPSIPLLILNSLQPQQMIQEKKNSPNYSTGISDKSYVDINITLKELLEVQKENLGVEKQKLEVEKQRLEFDRVVGSQLLTLVPMVGGLLQQLSYSSNHDEDINIKGRKRPKMEEIDIFKDSKILRTVLEQGIKKYMLGENADDEQNTEDEEDSGIPQEENSNASSK